MTESSPELLLDLRELEPPEPFVQSLAALEQLQAGQYLHLTHHRAPAMLYPELGPRGFVAQTCESRDGLFHILVWRESDRNSQEAASKRFEELAGRPL